MIIFYLLNFSIGTWVIICDKLVSSENGELYEHRIQQAELANSNQSETIKDLRRQLQEAASNNSNQSDNKYKKLQQELVAEKNNNKKLQQELVAEKNNNNKLQRQLDNMQKENNNNKLQQEIVAEKNNNKKLQQELVAEKNNNNKLQCQLDNMQKELSILKQTTNYHSGDIEKMKYATACVTFSPLNPDPDEKNKRNHRSRRSLDTNLW
jgi:predicted RNase H-like nuclease (RuvC/YqgF family)